MNRTSGERRRQRGAVIVETAFSIVVLIVLLFGIINMGMVFHDQASITNAARETARSLAVGDTIETAQTRAASASSGLCSGSSNPCTFTLQSKPDSAQSYSTVADDSSGTTNTANKGDLIQVRIAYQDPFLGAFSGGGTKQLKSVVDMRRE
jgi:Flp pilus assembly protein TadG